MFSDPTLYGATIPYREFPFQQFQFPFQPPFPIQQQFPFQLLQQWQSHSQLSLNHPLLGWLVHKDFRLFQYLQQ